MKLKALVDSLDDVDEKYRDLYVAFDDGGTERFKLDVDGIPNHPETKALQNAHERTKQRVRELNTQVNELREKADQLPEDFDADLYERAVTEGVGGGGKVKNEDEIRAEAAAAATKRAEEKAKKDLDKANARAEKLQRKVENQAKREALDAALDAAKVTDPALRRGARAILSESIKVVSHEDDEGLHFEALAKDPELGDIPVAEFVSSWAATDEGKTYVGARESAGGGANGGGQGGGNVPSSDNNPWKSATLNVTEQARIRREDPALATKLMKEAGLVVR
jgi:hypothetical protein